MNQMPHVHRSVVAVIPASAMLAAVVSLAVSLSVVNHVQLPFTTSAGPNIGRTLDEGAGTLTTAETQARDRALVASVTAHGASEHNPVVREMARGSSPISSQILTHAASERADNLAR